jgi:hypothetical protein
MSVQYRIAEEHRRFSIQVSKNGLNWHDLHPTPHIPRYFDSLADARSWVATIKRGVVYHDAEDAPNLAQDERKAESGNKVSDEWESIATRYIVERLKNNAIVDFDGESTHTISSVRIGRNNKIVISI